MPINYNQNLRTQAFYVKPFEIDDDIILAFFFAIMLFLTKRFGQNIIIKSGLYN